MTEIIKYKNSKDHEHISIDKETGNVITKSDEELFRRRNRLKEEAK